MDEVTASPGISARRGPVERWLLGHTRLTVVVVIAAGLAIRIAAIRGTHLGSDEAVHFQLVNVSSIAEVYRATLTNALASFSCWNIATREGNLTQMKAAVGTIRAAAPAGSLLFADLHSGLILSYYLGGSDFFHENPSPTHFWKSGAGGYRLVGSHQWAFNAKRFSSELQQFIESYSLSSGQTFWVVHVGRELDPAQVLSQQYPTARLTHRFQFGDIAVVEIRLP